jgi:hypothetical protein
MSLKDVQIEIEVKPKLERFLIVALVRNYKSMQLCSRLDIFQRKSDKVILFVYVYM